MDSRTGERYQSVDEAIKAGVPRRDVVMVSGEEAAVRRVSAAVKEMFKRLPPKRRRARMR